MLVLLARWRRVIATNTWNIANIASLSTNHTVPALIAKLPAGRDGVASMAKWVAATQRADERR